MSFSLGAAGGGAVEGLQDILKQRALEQELAERHRAAVADEALRSRQLDMSGENNSLLQQLKVYELQHQQQQDAQADLQKQWTGVSESTPMNADVRPSDVPVFRGTGHSNLLKAKPIDVQAGLGSPMLPLITGGGYTNAGTVVEQRQAQTDDRLQTAADLAARKQDETERVNAQRHDDMMKALAIRQQGAATAGTGTNDVTDMADGIEHGLLPPPNMTGGRMSVAQMKLGAELNRRHFNLVQARQDFDVVQGRLKSLNSNQQVRLGQAADFADEALDKVADLAKQWDGTQFPLVNRGSLAAAKAGAMGKHNQQIATQLETEIADVTEALGTVYMGGNGATDKALGLAATNLSSDWDVDTLLGNVKLAKQNLKYRKNSIAQSVAPVGGSDNNIYVPKRLQGTAPPPAGGTGDFTVVDIRPKQ